MKKIKLFTLALAALFVGNAMAKDYTPTKVFTVGDEASLGAKWADKGQPANYFVSGDTIIFTPFLCYQSQGEGKQEWTGNKGMGTAEATWNGMQCFKGNTAWGTGDAGAKTATIRSSRVAYYNVTNCSSVLALADLRGENREMYIRAFEMTDGVVSTEPALTATRSEDGIGVLELTGLDAAKVYQIQVLTNTGSNSNFYEVAFVTAPAAKDDATLKSITVDGKALEGFDPATETYNVELPFGTTAVPAVEAVATSKNANAVVTPAAAIPGATTIVVTAEDGTTIKTYTINFTAAQTASSEKELLNVTIDGKAVAISENAGSLLVSKNADLTALVVNFEVSESATASIESGSTQDFTNPLSIVVTAQDKSTATYTLTVTKAEKDVLYLTTASVEGDKMYGVVAAKGFYIEVRGEKNDNTDFSGYDLVVLHESLSGRDAADGELNELATANVPVLNTKSYFYPEGRWGWGACSNGNDQQGVKINTAKYTNIASHPLFAGLNDSITIYSTAKDKNIQPVTSFAKGKEGYVLANVAGGAAIHELPAAARVGAEGTAKYLLISLLNGQYADLTAEAETLLGNAVDYLLSAEAWVPQSGPQTALDNAVVAEKAQKMIVNGQLVIVKDGVMYNAQGAKINK